MTTGGLIETGAVDIDEEVVCSIKFRSETVLEDTDSGCSTSTLDTIASQEGTTQSGMHQSKYVYVHVFDQSGSLRTDSVHSNKVKGKELQTTYF